MVEPSAFVSLCREYAPPDIYKVPAVGFLSGFGHQLRRISAMAMFTEFQILLVEDNPADVLLTQEAFSESKIRHRLWCVTDGEQALQFLRQTGEYGDAPRPDVVLLDLNLPKKDGREILAEIKADPTLRQIPVIVLTTSKSEQDIFRAYKLHANCYLTKPVDLDEFVAKIRSLEDFWLSIVRLPAK
jgi:two-component system, chemotaxis family, response regulator Rcp1